MTVSTAVTVTLAVTLADNPRRDPRQLTVTAVETVTVTLAATLANSP